MRAGEPFSVFVTIENPFDIPIIILSAETHLPIELRDLFGEFLLEKSTANGRNEVLSKITNWRERVFRYLFFVWEDLFTRFTSKPVPQIAQAYSTKDSAFVAPTTQSNWIQITGDTNRAIQWITDVTLTIDPSIAPDDLEKYVHAISAIQKVLPNKDEVILRPGNSIIKQFLFQTRRWLFFIPFRHKMIIQIRYIADKTLNHDTVPFDLDIRASFGSTILGSAIGGLIGSLSRSPDITTWFTAPVFFPAMISSILAVITVVAFARKSDAQPLVAIEDFLGGLLLGFIVGYTGNALFEQVIKTATP